MTNCLNLGGIWQQISSRNSALRNTTPTGAGWDRMRGCWERRGRMKVLLGALGFLLTRWTSQCQFDAVVYSVVRHLVIGGGDIWHMASGVGLSRRGGGVSCKWGSECTGRRAWGVTCPSEGGVWTGPPVGDFPPSSQSRGWGSTLPTRGEGIHIVNFYHWHSFYFGGIFTCNILCCAISDKEQVLSLPFKMWDVW